MHKELDPLRLVEPCDNRVSVLQRLFGRLTPDRSRANVIVFSNSNRWRPRRPWLAFLFVEMKGHSAISSI